MSTGQIRGRKTSTSSFVAAPVDDINVKRKSARDLYQDYGIVQPAGWLSDEKSSDLAQSRDGNHSPQAYCHVCHVCHVCSHRTLATSECAACGHQFCQRCDCVRTTEVVGANRTSRETKKHDISREKSTTNSLKQVQQQAETVDSSTRTEYHESQQTTKTGRGVEFRSETKHEEHRVFEPKDSDANLRNKFRSGPSPAASNNDYYKQNTRSSQTQAESKSGITAIKTVHNRTTGTLKQNPFLVADSMISGNDSSLETNEANTSIVTLGPQFLKAKLTVDR